MHHSLTTSGGLYHVVLLELEVQDALSETVQLGPVGGSVA